MQIGLLGWYGHKFNNLDFSYLGDISNDVKNLKLLTDDERRPNGKRAPERLR